MGCVSSRETRPSREVSERSEEANRPRDLSFDVLREMASCFGRVERGDSWSQPQKEAISKGEEKLDMYQREFTRWKMGDVDSTLDAFHQDFETKIAENPKKRGDFIVVSKAKEGGASYANIIDINKGEIRGLSNKKESTIGWHFSEVIFNQFQLIMQVNGSLMNRPKERQNSFCHQEQTSADLKRAVRNLLLLQARRQLSQNFIFWLNIKRLLVRKKSQASP